MFAWLFGKKKSASMSSVMWRCLLERLGQRLHVYDIWGFRLYYELSNRELINEIGYRYERYYGEHWMHDFIQDLDDLRDDVINETLDHFVEGDGSEILQARQCWKDTCERLIQII